MHTYNFEKVSVKDTKKIRCKKCKKTTQETEEFCQTLNPWNKNKVGDVKTRSEIREEINKKLRDWRKIPIECNKC